jgi:hypothetical protein
VKTISSDVCGLPEINELSIEFLGGTFKSSNQIKASGFSIRPEISVNVAFSNLQRGTGEDYYPKEVVDKRWTLCENG